MIDDYGRAFYEYLKMKQASRNTLDSYRRDVEQYLSFLEKKGWRVHNRQKKKPYRLMWSICGKTSVLLPQFLGISRPSVHFTNISYKTRWLTETLPKP